MFKYSFNFFKILFVQISDIGQHVDVVDTRPPLAVFQNGMINQSCKVEVFLVFTSRSLFHDPIIEHNGPS